MRMHYVTHSEARPNQRNEDAIAAQFHPNAAHGLLCVLPDGQGGRAGGALASQLAVQTSLEVARTCTVAQLLNQTIWADIVRAADAAVSANTEAGFSTLIGLVVADNQVCGASCGDSAVLLVGESHYDELTAKQRKNPPIGSRAALPIPFVARLRPGSKLLIMSDGVWKGVGYAAIVQLSQAKHGNDLIHAIRQLQRAQNGGQLPDDFSMIVVQQDEA